VTRVKVLDGVHGRAMLELESRQDGTDQATALQLAHAGAPVAG